MREEESKLLEEILWRNVIEPLSSLWASGVLLDKKRIQLYTCFCINYHRLNSAKLKDGNFNLPHTYGLSAATWFFSAGFVNKLQASRNRTS